MMGTRIVVIGSGFGGLAAAVRLQARGHAVTLVEKRDKPGGRAYVYERDGFVFDGGPTIITAPWMIDELFHSAGRDPGRLCENGPGRSVLSGSFPRAAIASTTPAIRIGWPNKSARSVPTTWTAIDVLCVRPDASSKKASWSWPISRSSGPAIWQKSCRIC